MCFFINLLITGQTQSAEAQTAVDRLATHHGLRLWGAFPSYQITDGHCSCHLVLAEGRAIKPVAFMEALLSMREIKNVKVGWTWAVGQNVSMQPGVTEVRLSIQEFVECNTAENLQPDVWYRLHDPLSYSWV